MPKWWEKEPLRFECQPDCFKCCSKPGVVYFDSEDIRHAARYLECAVSDFKRTYLTREDGEWMIDVPENEVCPFLTETGCGIHDVKPRQCRAYPFWRENLHSRNHWKLAAIFCPGIDRGPMVPVEMIKKLLTCFRR